MAITGGVDVRELRRVVSDLYGQLSEDPSRGFHFPTGREWARDLEYDPELLARVPEGAAESFAGVGNPFAMGALNPGEVVLDLGCGAGTDVLMAAQMVGPEGAVTGMDMTPAMARKARANAAAMGAGNVSILDGTIEDLPLPDAGFDVVISNGVVDLVPDKERLFGEVLRVLRSGGRIQFADVTLENAVSESASRDVDLWAQ